jgi:hypothetical protein
VTSLAARIADNLVAAAKAGDNNRVEMLEARIDRILAIAGS